MSDLPLKVSALDTPASDAPAGPPDITAAIAGLFVYPIKSCAGVSVNQTFVLGTGLEFDRAWMVVDAHGQFLTQRELPRMALVQPQLKHFEMVLRAPGMLALHVQLDVVQTPCRVTVWADTVPAYDMGAIAAQWFTDFLGQPARLVRFDPDHQRFSERQYTDSTKEPNPLADGLNQFSDGYPLLVIGQASLDQFNTKLALAGHAAVAMARFRPNIVLVGQAELLAHDEDRFASLHIQTEQGAVHIKPVKPCARCPIVNIDPLTGLSTPAVGDMLQTHRQDARLGGTPSFGMNAVVINPAEHLLVVGQKLQAYYRF